MLTMVPGLISQRQGTKAAVTSEPLRRKLNRPNKPMLANCSPKMNTRIGTGSFPKTVEKSRKKARSLKNLTVPCAIG